MEIVFVILIECFSSSFNLDDIIIYSRITINISEIKNFLWDLNLMFVGINFQQSFQRNKLTQQIHLHMQLNAYTTMEILSNILIKTYKFIMYEF